MGLLPIDADILPPSDDRVFKLILTKDDAKPVLMDLISAVIDRPVKGTAEEARRDNDGYGKVGDFLLVRQ